MTSEKRGPKATLADRCPIKVTPIDRKAVTCIPNIQRITRSLIPANVVDRAMSAIANDIVEGLLCNSLRIVKSRD